MKSKRTYRASRVEQVNVAELLPLIIAGCIIAIDVAKQKFAVAIATAAGEIVKLFRFDHPTETADFLEVVKALQAGVDEGKVVAAMEPTGTYGDAIRLRMHQAGVPVRMVSPKRTYDSRELFDGVPSLHDPKSAALIAKLQAHDLSTPWTPPATHVTRLRALVDLRLFEHQRQEMAFGKLEAALARHWPEFGRWMNVREQSCALQLLVTFPNPAEVAQAQDKAASLLREASRGRLSEEAVKGVLDDAQKTFGVPMVPEEVRYVRTIAEHLRASRGALQDIDKQLREMAKTDEVFERLYRWMGPYTAAVIVSHVDPCRYGAARKLEKGCGLNMREKSSGQTSGRVSITKRGPGVVRQVLYLFALRMIQDSAVVRAWYERRTGHTENSRHRAVVAVMRKLVKAMFYVARGAQFDATKLFDVRRLDLEAKSAPTESASDSAPTPKGPSPRTTPREIARSKDKRAMAAKAQRASA